MAEVAFVVVALVDVTLVEVTMRVDEALVEETLLVTFVVAAFFVVVECPSHAKTASVMQRKTRDLASMSSV